MVKSKIILSAAIAAIMTTMTAMAAEYVPFSDTDSKAVEALSRLGIISGYDDGTFRPDNIVTRAEAAQIIMLAAHRDEVENVRETMNNDTDELFTDINKEHWAYPAVNIASSCQVIDGYDDGSFRPDDNVTEEQLIKMAVAVCGYNGLAEIEGYPEGYVKRAKLLGICENAEDKPATRSFVAEAVFNMLHADAQFVTGFGMNSNGMMSPDYRSVPYGISIYNKIAQIDAVITEAKNGRALIKSVKNYCVPEEFVDFDEETQEDIWKSVIEEGGSYEMSYVYDDLSEKVGQTCRLYILYEDTDGKYTFDIAYADNVE